MTKKGIIVSTAAGNEGELSFHANGKFGPKRAGLGDNKSSEFELVISETRSSGWTTLTTYFDTRDEWGIIIAGTDKFLVDRSGRPLPIRIFKKDGRVGVEIPRNSFPPQGFAQYLYTILDKGVKLSDTQDGRDLLAIPLKPGTYQIIGMGMSENVVNGEFNMYVPAVSEGSFTIGGRKSHMVASPGTSAGVITVGAYDFRSEWLGLNNLQTAYSLKIGSISTYSSPGGLIDQGVYKPDIAAPATYTISTLSSGVQGSAQNCSGSKMITSTRDPKITSDGRHIAWSGTSAATPFVTGVIALMLQKNPDLTTEQVRQILVKTADKGGDIVGATPNPHWGHGRINPEAAIKATPLPRPVPKPPLRRKTR
jgi:subtilisin family serine protease